MFSKLIQNPKNINIFISIVFILIFFSLFRFILKTINIVSDTSQTNFSYSIRTREMVEKIDKVFETADLTLNVLAESISLSYDTDKLYDESYNSKFLNKIDAQLKATLLNNPDVDGAWFQVNASLPFSFYTYSWYQNRNGKCINIKKKLESSYPEKRALTPADDPYYYQALKSNKIYWSDIYVDPDLKTKMITADKPIYKNNKLVGVVGIDLSVDKINSILVAMRSMFKDSDVFLLDQNNNTILYSLHNTPSDNYSPPDFKLLFKNKLNQENSIVFYRDSSRKKTAVLLTLVNDFRTIVTIPNDLIFKGLSKLFKIVYFTFFLLMALSVFLLLNIKELRHANTELENRAKKLNTIFDSSPNIIVLKGKDKKYKLCNYKFAELFNITSIQITGKTAQDIFTKEQADQIDKMESIVFKTKKMVSYEAVYNGIDGELYLRKYIIPLFDTNNELVEILIIAVDITKSKIEQKILREAKEAAEHATLMKSNFLANMSHEIRTPLNGVLGFIQLLKETKLSQEQNEFVIDAQKSSEVLLDIINDILDFSKIEAGKLQLENISFDLRSLVEDITLFANANAENKGLEVSSLICSDVPKRVIGDPGRIRQILNNLLSNSIKFTHSGEIVIYMKQILEDNDTAFVSFEVKDTGIGIDEEKLNYIFEEFIQSDASMTRKYGGTGLGLAICQRLVSMMDGSIHVKSKVDEGSTFTFSLPLKKDVLYKDDSNSSMNSLNGAKILVIDDNSTDLKIIQYYLSEANCVIYEAHTCNEAVDIINREKENISLILVDYKMQISCDSEFCTLYNENDEYKDIPIILYTSLAKRGDSAWAQKKGFKGYLTKPIKKSDLIDTISMVINCKKNNINDEFVTKHVIKERKFSSKTRILVVEDSNMNCKLINKILSNNGLSCDFAYNGLEALNALKSNKYDLILMDCQMPILDGYEATQEIRKIEGDDSHIPIIAMTANAMPKDREKCLNIGMDDYISKPIDINLLLDTISKFIPNNDYELTSEPVKKADLTTIEVDNVSEFDNILNKVSDELMFEKQDILDLFIEYFEFLPQAINDLENAVAEDDAKVIASIAHKVKGASANLRVEEIAQISLELETAAKQEKGKNIYAELVNKLKLSLEHLNSLFSRYTV